MVSLGVLLYACSGGGGGESGTTEADAIENVEVEPTESGTVFHVTWTSLLSGTGRLEFGEDDAYGESTPAESTAATTHAATLFVPAGETWHFRVVETSDGGETRGDDQTATAADAPPDLPIVAVDGDFPADAWLVLSVVNVPAAIVIDGQGRYRWWHEETTDVDVIRAMPSLDGAQILYQCYGQEADVGQVVRVNVDGDVADTVPVPLATHDMVELPDGTLASLVIERVNDGGVTNGTILVEIAPDGTQRTVFDAFDHFDPATTGGDPTDWTHGNAVDYDAERDRYLVGLRNFGSILSVDRASGDLQWGFSGDANTFDIDGTQFAQQHQFELQGDRLLVFANHLPDEADPTTVLEYTLDEDRQTATEIDSLIHDPPVSDVSLGDVHRFADGSTLVVWGVDGEVQVLDPDGDATWTLSTAGFPLGYATLVTPDAAGHLVGFTE